MKVAIIGLAFAALTAGAALAAENNTSAPSAANGGGAVAPAAPTPRVGSLVKDTSGQALGRVARVTPATATEPAKVTIRIADEQRTVPQDQLAAKDNYFVYSPKGEVKAYLPFQAGW